MSEQPTLMLDGKHAPWCACVTCEPPISSSSSQAEPTKLLPCKWCGVLLEKFLATVVNGTDLGAKCPNCGACEFRAEEPAITPSEGQQDKEEYSPAVKKAMARFYKRLAELRETMSKDTTEPAPVSLSVGEPKLSQDDWQKIREHVIYELNFRERSVAEKAFELGRASALVGK